MLSGLTNATCRLSLVSRGVGKWLVSRSGSTVEDVELTLGVERARFAA